MRRLVCAPALAVWLSICSPAMGAAQPSAQQQASISKYRAILESLHPISGDVAVPAANGVLHLGDRYYFLPAPDAKRVLTEGWGNPADSVDDVLGMVFPAGKIFTDDTWGAVVTYHQSGYITDDDAQTADYNKIITDSRADEDESNQARQKQGFPVQHLVGWAQPPAYDAQTHSVIWARDIRFGDQQDDALNYDVRLLGRRGVLSLNMVSAMSKLPEVRAAAARFGQVASFDTGSRYVDYDPKTDEKAGYGIAGLVAAGVGVVAAKKLGLIAILALAGKKLFVVIAALFAGGAARLKRLFRRTKAE